ncbi:hypothetical protein GCM10010960_17070 [Arenimonas maotaiensis]|uniref:DUF3916 domain-containing protein n=1 Tax=Arenimonas maotaiensis TaxID=1446479 RepID=A0A917FR84_9GAMM|nr:DUF3916 domain-containing protein [Arenimonas maotaiensis]GGF95975.1 hypothetical protein GCM10010960_17070 [Arenimonas maotaiensis]
MARRLISAHRKLRGAPRRLRALRRWAESFRGWFPQQADLDPADRYWHIKIPVDRNLVEGRWATEEIRRDCVASLLTAAGHLAGAKPAWAQSYRVTAALMVPSLFSSELCIYLDEAYFREHTSLAGPGRSPANRSITDDLSLKLPRGFGEIGFVETQQWDEGETVVEELWWLGEVGPTPNNSSKPTPLRGAA